MSVTSSAFEYNHFLILFMVHVGKIEYFMQRPFSAKQRQLADVGLKAMDIRIKRKHFF